MKKYLTILVLLPLFSCHFIHKRITGSGHIKTETRNLSGFNGVDVGGSYDVFVKQDSLHSVKIEADENLMEYIQTEIKGNTLVITTRDGFNLKGSKGIKVYLTSPEFRNIDLSGSCNVKSENQLVSNGPVEFDLSGSSDLDLDVKSPSIKTGLSGSGSVIIRGQTKNFSVDGSGSMTVKAIDLMAENVQVEISGSGNAEVFASVKLDIRVSGSGDVRYKGNAAVSQHISGSGSVTKMD